MARRRDYRAEFRRRDALARERGFSSYWDLRQSARSFGTTGEFLALPKTARENRAQAIRALDLAARERTSVEAAAQSLGVSMKDLRFWARRGLRRSGRRTYAAPEDQLLRPRPLFVEGDPPGVEIVLAGGRREAGRAERAFRIQWRFIHGRATADEVRKLRRFRIGGRRVLNDPDALERVAMEQDLDDVLRGT